MLPWGLIFGSVLCSRSRRGCFWT